MGNIDRIFRILLALLIAFLYLSKEITGTLGIVLLILAGILALTSFISFCPLYAPFKFKTNNQKK